jgi:diguanylate cyclase (GGDEF)-like protein/PAS domain S-box-containing protein
MLVQQMSSNRSNQQEIPTSATDNELRDCSLPESPVRYTPVISLSNPKRIDAVKRTELLDSDSKTALDRLTLLLRRVLQAPVTMVSLLDDRREFFLSQQGLPEPWAGRREIPLSHSLGQHVVASGVPWVISDARKHELVCKHLELGDLGIVAYLGVPLRDVGGQMLGSLCAIDTVPRTWNAEDLRTLEEFSALVMTELELQRQLRERREAEQTLRASEERFRAVAEALPSVVWTASPNGEIDYVSDRFRKITGVTPNAAQGVGWAQVIHPEDLAVVMSNWQKSLSTGRLCESHCRVQQGNGSFRWTLIRALPKYDSKGTIVRWAGISVDIHDQVAAEQTLREREQQLQTALDSANLGVWSVDLATMALIMDDRCYRIANLDPQRQLSLDELAKLIHPSDQASREAALTRAFETGEAFSIEYRVRGDDGLYHWIKSHGRPERDEQGRTSGFIGIARNISAGKAAEQELRESQRRYQMLANVMPTIVWTAHLEDGTLAFDFLNEFGQTFTGRTIAELQHNRWLEIIHPDDHELVGSTIARSFETSAPVEKECRFLSSDGTWRWHLARAVSFVQPDGQLGLIGVAIDISEQQIAQQALRESEALFRGLSDSSPIGVFRADLDGNVTYANERASEIWDMPFEEGNTRGWIQAIHPDDVDRVITEWMRANAEGRNATQQYRLLRPTGEIRHVRGRSSILKDASGRPIATIGTVDDITEQIELQEELTHMALHDALTGAANRVLLRDRCEQALARAERHGSKVAMLAIDLDRFKEVNDSFGHQFGDELLKAVVGRLSATIRATDTLARVGGDEFVCLLEDVHSPSHAERIAATILESLAQPFMIQGVPVQAPVSIGLALSPDDGMSSDELRRHADAALYQAKQIGRNQYVRYAKTAQTRQQIVREALSQALEERRLHLEYQPQFAADRQLRGFEALLRFTHPDLGRVSPAEFIPVAEQSGLIVPIGTWVLEEACSTAAKWRARGLEAGVVSVNVSALQFAQPNFADTVAQTLTRTGLPASCLELELTESIVMADVAESTQQMKRLKDIGVGLAIDDFGTGYSSLKYLHHLPIDTLKIDRSFVSELGDAARVRPIVEAIIALAHALGIKLVAEGVETEEQQQQLIAMGCHHLQGYLLQRPLPASQVEALLHSSHG